MARTPRRGRRRPQREEGGGGGAEERDESHEKDVDGRQQEGRQVKFHRDVLKLTREVPRHALTTYGDIAKALGLPNYSRHVGFALASMTSGSDVPWWRVINSSGRISFRPKDRVGQGTREKPFTSRQKQLLEQEGHEFNIESGLLLGWRGKLHRFEPM